MSLLTLLALSLLTLLALLTLLLFADVLLGSVSTILSVVQRLLALALVALVVLLGHVLELIFELFLALGRRQIVGHVLEGLRIALADSALLRLLLQLVCESLALFGSELAQRFAHRLAQLLRRLVRALTIERLGFVLDVG